MVLRVASRRWVSQVSHVTTPIFYPNAKPHLGHLYSSLLCDVFHRWQVLTGKDSLLTTGTDEHGLKIQIASEKNGYSSPRDFVDRLYKDFIKLDEASNVQFTRFIRTTDPDHVANVAKLWELCRDRGFIYRGEHKGWYSVSDETFYPESKVVRSPTDSTKYINTETNNEVVYQTENNYFFKLSAFKDKLISHIHANRSFIYPEAKRTQILKELEGEGSLQDLSVSRPSSRLKWGIEVPGDSSQRVYVWFDALCNYVTSIGGIESLLANETPATNLLHSIEYPRVPSSQWWQNTTHVIGKDIIRFHTIYWPAFLMAAGLPLPKNVVVHSHWLSNGVKMSKSLGNVVDPLLMINYYGADPMRWFLLENAQLEEDGDFQESKLHNTRELLVSKWGNLINRCCGSKFNLHRAVNTFASNENISVTSVFDTEPVIKEEVEQLLSAISVLPRLMDGHMNQFQTRLALKGVWSIIDRTNAFMQAAKPWARGGSQQDAIIFVCMEISRILSILCQPIIPELASRFLDRVDVSPVRRTLAYAKLYADDSYGQHANEKGRELPLQRKARREA